ncbi:MAG: zinc metalloprotease HtpX [Ardenticatenaceae bacterium]|nr:zinc metalloprotease HtpX [Ardenticatenaceae bacterium]HBY99350.1 zinc metalloprotease HtpX [Chloroflexota bacterium]
MRQKWYGGDLGLQARMFITLFLLAAVYLAFIAAMFYAGADTFTIMLFAAVLLGVQYFFSDKLVLAASGAREVTPDQAPELHAMIDRLVQQADLPKPKVAIIESKVPNAFATGRSPSAAAVAVTTGLLNTLDRREVEAVLAHEMTHVKNRDMTVITIASFFATVAQFIMRIGFWGGFGMGRRRRGGNIAVLYLGSLLVWFISFFLIRALSRYREFAADRGSALLTGSPATLASALVKISGTMQRIPDRDLREVEGLNAFFIIPASARQSLLELFSTHPSLEKRLAYLERIQREMEQVRA